MANLDALYHKLNNYELALHSLQLADQQSDFHEGISEKIDEAIALTKSEIRKVQQLIEEAENNPA